MERQSLRANNETEQRTRKRPLNLEQEREERKLCCQQDELHLQQQQQQQEQDL